MGFQCYNDSMKALLQSPLKFPTHVANNDVAKLIWLTRLRWFAIGLFLFLILPAFKFGFLRPEHILFYLFGVCFLFTFNLISAFFFTEKRFTEATNNQRINSFIFCFQFAVDLLILTYLLSFSGGIKNPFIVLFLFNAALGGLLIPGRVAFPFLMLMHSLLASLQVQFTAKSTPTPLITTYILITHFLVLAFWLVMRNLGSYLEKRNQAETLASLTLERQDRLRSIGALAAGFSHEFASPLNTAKIRLQRMMRFMSSHPEISEELKQEMYEALSAIEDCEGILHQMNSSQLDSRDYQIKKIVVAELLMDVIDSWKEEHEDALLDIQILDRSHDSIPPVNFAQVVLNLLDNAYEAAPSKPIDVKFEFSQGQFKLSIQDQGAGVPRLVLEKQYEPFITTKPHGTGLGLYVSQLFANSLGGQLQIQNLSSPQGARVEIVWPQQKDRE